MPIPEPVTPLQPWQTAWPAGIALLGLAVGAVRARAHLRPRGADLQWMLPVVVLAVVVRLWFVPALGAHYFDGHEAEYWDIYRRVRPLNRGGTVLYPAMQWMWWGLGALLPHHRAVPVVVMALLGSVGCVLVGSAVGRFTGNREGAVWAGLVLALHPVHAAWSTSAYNVMVPWFFSAVLIWAASVLARTRRPPLSLVWVASMAGALVAATRMEASWIAAPALGLALLGGPSDQPSLRRLRSVGSWVLPVGAGAALGGAAIVYLVFPGEVPGAGERALSFLINRTWSAPYAPLDGWLGGLAVTGLCVVAVARRAPGALVFAGAAVGAHLVLASFDDFGDRHTLSALFALALLLGAAVARADRWRVVGRALAGVIVALCVVGLADMRERFYGSEEAFAHVLTDDVRWSSLPRWTAEAARQDCGWIAEDPRVAPSPQKSHFNLLDAAEAETLREGAGCLRWCLDVQDWRWSSRGVRDRALRTARLYALTPTAVVEDAGSGYACLVMELGPRSCCPSEPVGASGTLDARSGPNPAARPGRSHEEDDASGSLYHSPIP